MKLTSQSIILAALICILTAVPALADIYIVTATQFRGDGSLFEAIGFANANPGPDTIEFNPGLKVDARGESENYLGISDASTYVLALITDELVIDGKGGELFGVMGWVNASGIMPMGDCPTQPTIIFTGVTPGLFTLGKKNKDNSDVKLTIKNLDIREFNHLVYLQKNSSLVMENVNVTKIYPILRCVPDAMINAQEGASVALHGCRFEGLNNFADFPRTEAVIAGNFSKDLLIENCEFNEFRSANQQRAGSIFWSGTSDSKVNIVSSVFYDVGGFYFEDGLDEANIVNSIWNNQTVLSLQDADFFTNATSGDVNFIASTLMWNTDVCEAPCGLADVLPYDFFQQVGSGMINFYGSAVAYNFAAELGDDSVKILSDAATGGYSADAYTWMQPTLSQDADALKFITGQNGLRTAPVAFNTGVFELLLIPLVTPAPGPFPGGQLIDVITDAGSDEANELLHPVTGDPIVLDALGNPRVEEVATGDFRRNIGAIQLTADPHLSVTGTGDQFVDLHWNKPLIEEGITPTGYEVQHRIGPVGAWMSETAGGADNLDRKVTGLTNGTEYEFRVRTVGTDVTNVSYEGPWSNLVTATPYGTLGTPVVTAEPGDKEVHLSWTLPDLGGRQFESFLVLWGKAGSGEYTDGQGFGDKDTTTLTVTGLKNGTEYEFAVSVNAGGDVSKQGLATATPHGDIGTVDRSPDESLPATKEANKPGYWEKEGYGDDCEKHEVGDDFGSVWYLDANASALILKSNLVNDVWEDPIAGRQYGTASAKDISHAIVCYDNP